MGIFILHTVVGSQRGRNGVDSWIENVVNNAPGEMCRIAYAASRLMYVIGLSRLFCFPYRPDPALEEVRVEGEFN